jgi:hypothetical protein
MPKFRELVEQTIKEYMIRDFSQLEFAKPEHAELLKEKIEIMPGPNLIINDLLADELARYTYWKIGEYNPYLLDMEELFKPQIRRLRNPNIPNSWYSASGAPHAEYRSKILSIFKKTDKQLEHYEKAKHICINLYGVSSHYGGQIFILPEHLNDEHDIWVFNELSTLLDEKFHKYVLKINK